MEFDLFLTQYYEYLKFLVFIMICHTIFHTFSEKFTTSLDVPHNITLGPHTQGQNADGVIGRG